jgi:4-amino-4-deoxy-L-arabinose transferase-like glycosyltransferase
MRTIRAWLSQRSTIIIVAALICWYSAATLPYLGNFPLIGRDEAQIAAPAYKLASQGVYGQDLYTGYYRSEHYVYEFLPIHPLLLALCFELLGLGAWQGRLVSVLCGLAIVLLTFALGRQLYNAVFGLLAAAVLCLARLSLEPRVSGLLLLDQARIMRYDIVVPVWLLLSLICFYWAHRRNLRLGYLGTGLLAGLATLSHIYGAFILAVFMVALLWHEGWRSLRQAAIYLIIGGWMLAMLPWLLYAAQDPAAYYGQTLLDQAAGRFELLNPRFYWNNLINEPRRYGRLVRGQSSSLLQPRVGIWLMMAGVPVANFLLCRQIWRRNTLSLPDRLLLITLPVLAGLMGLLVTEKRFDYIVLVLPFLALQIAFAALAVWRWAARHARVWRWLCVVVCVATVLEAAAGVVRSLRVAQSASPYMQFTQDVGQLIPPGARIMAVHMYWIGLAEFDMRSLDLPFRFSNPNYYKPQALTMEQAMQQIAPTYLLVDPLIENYIFYPIQQIDDPLLKRQIQEFTRSVFQHCTGIVATVDRPEYASYGPMKIYRCQWSAATS